MLVSHEWLVSQDVHDWSGTSSDVFRQVAHALLRRAPLAEAGGLKQLLPLARHEAGRAEALR